MLSVLLAGAILAGDPVAIAESFEQSAPGSARSGRNIHNSGSQRRPQHVNYDPKRSKDGGVTPSLLLESGEANERSSAAHPPKRYIFRLNRTTFSPAPFVPMTISVIVPQENGKLMFCGVVVRL